MYLSNPTLKSGVFFEMNMNWTRGYAASSGYTFGVYPELTPSRLNWLALLKSARSKLKGFRYLELGCGQGYGLILNSLHHPDSEFVGIDFMPEHVAHAKELATAAGLKNIEFIEGDFIELASNNSQLGQFDFVVAHGVTTWVSAEIRNSVFELASKCLIPGGLMFNSYNTLPGWLASYPFQNLVKQYQEYGKGMMSISKAVSCLQNLEKAGALLFAAYPDLNMRLQNVARSDSSYVVQEYCNLHWNPMFSADMLNLASQYKLDFLSSATLSEAFDRSYPKAILDLISEQPSLFIKETLKDYCLKQDFRRDVYVKGKLSFLSAVQHREILNSALIWVPLLPFPEKGNDFEFPGSLHVRGNREKYIELIEAFGIEGKTIQAITDKLPHWDLKEIIFISSILLQNGFLAFKHGGNAKRVADFNRLVLSRVLDGARYRHVALGGAAGAFQLGDLEIITLGLIAENPEYTNDTLISQKLENKMQLFGISFMEENKAVTDKERSKQLALSFVKNFIERSLPVFRDLKVL